MRELAAPLIVLLALTACGGEAEDAGPRRDAATLLEVLAPTEPVEALGAANRFVADELPVRAGDVLEERALPALRRMQRDLNGATIRSDEGRAFVARLEPLLAARIEATRTYRDVLARGLAEDLRFVEASAGLREAEGAYFDYLDELHRIRDGRTDEPEEASEESESDEGPP